MIQPRTMLIVADNTGAKIVQCFNILGGTKKRYARVGDVIVGSVKKAEPRKLVKEHQKVRAIIIRQRQPIRRKDGTYVKFDDNACVILDGKNPKGNRIFGPVAMEVKEKGFDAVAALAKEII